MDAKLTPGLKTTFLIHALVATVFGLLYLFIPEAWSNLVQWPIKEIEVYRLLGAALIGFGTSSWLAYFASTREAVIIIVRMELVWTVLGTFVLLYGVLFTGLPVFAWVNVGLMALFAVLFSVFYPRK